MLYVVRGVALLMTNGRTLNDLSGTEGLGNTGFEWLGFHRILGVPSGVLIMAVVALVIAVVLGSHHLRPLAVCDRRQSAGRRAVRVPVRRVTVWVYVVSGLVLSDRRGHPGLHADQRQPHGRQHLRADGDRRWS